MGRFECLNRYPISSYSTEEGQAGQQLLLDYARGDHQLLKI